MANIDSQYDKHYDIFVPFEPRESPAVTHGQTVGVTRLIKLLSGFGPGGKSQA